MYQAAGPAARDGRNSRAFGYNLGDLPHPPRTPVSPEVSAMGSTVLAAACFVTSWAIAAPKLKDPPTNDAPSLVGEWVSDHENGRRYIFTTDGRFTYVLGKGSTAEYTYTADPTKTPAEIDLVPAPGGGPVVPGIYKIEGDTLTVCFTTPGAPRPTRFEKSDTPHVGLSVYKRVKAKD
jgi:uncharacterized protein (TIGR03067 family)